MRLKSVLVSLSLSLICLVPNVSFAGTLTLTGVGGTNTNVTTSCLNFNREISADALLYNRYAGAFDAIARSLASSALANAGTASASNFARDESFLPNLTNTSGRTHGKP